MQFRPSKKAVSAALALAACLFMSGCGPDRPVLYVYTWSDYIDPEVKAGLEERFGCVIDVSTFDSNEAMYAKLKAGGGGYDVLVPSSYQVAQLAAEGMIERIDRSLVPNAVAGFDPAFSGQVLDPSMEWSVPYAVTYTGFLYLKSRCGAPRTWADALENPAFSQKVMLLDDMREVIGAALMRDGLGLNSEDPAEIAAAAERACAWRASVRKFDSEGYKTDIASGSVWIGHGYSSDAIQLMQENADVGFCYPEEGFTVACDELCVAKGCRNRELAHAVINALYEPETAARNMRYVCCPMPVKGGMALLTPDERAAIAPPPELAAKGQPLKGFVGKPEVSAAYNRAWDRVKALRR